MNLNTLDLEKNRNSPNNILLIMNAGYEKRNGQGVGENVGMVNSLIHNPWLRIR